MQNEYTFSTGLSTMGRSKERVKPMSLNNEQRITELGQMVQLLASMVEDMGMHIDAIYRELDMVDGEDVLQSTYDFCDCDKTYGHMCQDLQRI
jgi:fructose-1,6-bisphosphatase/sedoheptulose 1,7-bisphosphatase-like protein